MTMPCMMAPASVTDAYRHCEQVTRRQARNFAYGIRLLPPAKRSALSAVYAMARRVDDIGDGDLPPAQKRVRLAGIRSALHDLGRPGDDPVLIALGHAAQEFALPIGAFDELVDGCLADVDGTRYEDFEQLRHYCRCVAGSIGRLSLAVFGTARPERDRELADALGVALQLTNILRDIVEDLGNGRIYLPAQDLRRFGCTLDPEPAGGTDEPDRLAALVEFEAARAQEWYDLGLQLLPRLDRRSTACVAAMAGIYHRLLIQIRREPLAVFRRRVSLTGWQKARVAAIALAGGVP